LQCDPGEIEMPTTLVEEEKTRWRELFCYPRSMAAACTIAPSQTGGVGILMWIAALFVMVLKITQLLQPLLQDAVASDVKRIDLYVIRWARRKFKRLRRKTKGARDWFDRLRRANPTLFAHWQLCHGNGRTSGAV
jgi:hypothetical protein